MNHKACSVCQRRDFKFVAGLHVIVVTANNVAVKGVVESDEFAAEYGNIRVPVLVTHNDLRQTVMSPHKCRVGLTDQPSPEKKLECQMIAGCPGEVAMVDAKGFVYCRGCGVRRKHTMRCRKLKPAEVKKLKQGEAIYY